MSPFCWQKNVCTFRRLTRSKLIVLKLALTAYQLNGVHKLIDLNIKTCSLMEWEKEDFRGRRSCCWKPRARSDQVKERPSTQSLPSFSEVRCWDRRKKSFNLKGIGSHSRRKLQSNPLMAVSFSTPTWGKVGRLAASRQAIWRAANPKKILTIILMSVGPNLKMI